MLLKIAKRLIEGITLAGAVLLPSAVESHILFGVAGVVLLVIFCLEQEAWEGGV